MKTVVVGENLISKGLQFYWWDFKHEWPEGHEAILNLYLDREYNDMEGFKLDLNNSGQLYQNDLLTGKYLHFAQSLGHCPV